MKGRQGVMGRHCNNHIEFMADFINQGQPPNLIIVLDTHSDSFSGQLQATGGLRGAQKTNLTLPDLVRMCVGDSVLHAMGRASEISRAYNVAHKISPGVAPWADITPGVHGGWRVMAMVSCGSALQQVVHWDYIT